MSIKVSTLLLSWLTWWLVIAGGCFAVVLFLRTMYTLNHMNTLVAGVRKKREKSIRALSLESPRGSARKQSTRDSVNPHRPSLQRKYSSSI